MVPIACAIDIAEFGANARQYCIVHYHFDNFRQPDLWDFEGLA